MLPNEYFYHLVSDQPEVGNKTSNLAPKSDRKSKNTHHIGWDLSLVPTSYLHNNIPSPFLKNSFSLILSEGSDSGVIGWYLDGCEASWLQVYFFRELLRAKPQNGSETVLKADPIPVQRRESR